MSELSAKTGISRPTLHRLIRGEGNPVISNLLKVACELNCPLNTMLGLQKGGLKIKNKPEKNAYQALTSSSPQGDPRSLEIYEAACREEPADKIGWLVDQSRFLLAGERYEDAVTRAILDVFYNRQCWIDVDLLPRDRDSEKDIQKKFKLPDRSELGEEERCPVRVINLGKDMAAFLQIHALAAAGAALVKELSQTYSTIGLSDGLVISTLLRFLKRGDLDRATLVPVTFTPRYAHFELSGATLIGAVARTHQGYRVTSTVEVGKLQKRINEIRLMVTSCGTVLPIEPHSRIAQLFRESWPEKSYDQFVAQLIKKGVVGDLLYQFLKPNGHIVDGKITAGGLETADIDKIYRERNLEDTPAIYAISLKCMAEIAQRGICMVIVHSPERAQVIKAALERDEKPVNFIVCNAQAAAEFMRR
ncbi:MAG: helix-turn-helix transcriptional regulator [Planctomycetes bacterium]|nr:helix-turn-helix transcriptional regulator [Planctomycetota bacterium]